MRNKILISILLMAGILLTPVPLNINAIEENSTSQTQKSGNSTSQTQESADYKKYIGKDSILNIKKELYICDEGVNQTTFNCERPGPPGFPVPPENSGKYVSCENVDCPNGLSKSIFIIRVTDDFIFNPAENPSQFNLNGERFTVLEESPMDEDAQSSPEFACKVSGFDTGLKYSDVLGGGLFPRADVCVNYEGECSGIIYPGEVKECTIKNYVVNYFLAVA